MQARKENMNEGSLGKAASWPIYLFSTLILVFLAVVVVTVDGRLISRSQQEMGRELSAVLRTTQGSIDQWFRDQQDIVATWSEHPKVENMILELLAVEADFGSLSTSAHQEYLLELFSPFVARKGVQGFSVYSLQGVILAGSRRAELGRKDSSEEIQQFLNKVLQPGIRAAVSLPLQGTGTNFSTMLAASAIHNQAGDPLAILVFRINPEHDFTEILQRGRMGDSGESYAFSRDGKMISQSRFDEDLKKIGLVPDLGRSILMVDIRDPGGNLLEGFRWKVIREKQPLTLMAQSAMDEGPGGNLTGYNDYRGVPVIGQWTWDPLHEFGIATEIDVAEAYASMEAIRRLFFGLSGTTGILIALLTIFFILNRRKAETTRIRLADQATLMAEAEERNRLLLESVRDGIFGVDLDGKVSFINPAVLELLGYDADDLMGKPIHPIIHHSYADGSPYPVEECPMRAAFTKGKGSLVENEVLWRKDGEAIDVEYAAVPMRKGNDLIGAVIVFRDIRERKANERKIRDSEREFKAMVATIPGTVYRCEPDEQRTMRFISPEVERLSGYPPEDFLGNEKRSFASITNEIDLEYVTWP